MNANVALRLHLAEPEPICSAPDVEMGLKYWREINDWPNRWATFDCAQFKHSRIINVTWGQKYANGSKERALETLMFTMIGEQVYVTRHTHF